MPFPYDFPFYFEVERVLRMLIRGWRQYTIKPEIEEPLRVLPKDEPGAVYPTGRVVPPLVIGRRAVRPMTVKGTFEGGG